MSGYRSISLSLTVQWKILWRWKALFFISDFCRASPCSSIWCKMNSYGVSWTLITFVWVGTPPCSAAMRKGMPDYIFGNPLVLQAQLGDIKSPGCPEMPFSWSSWLLKQSWHLRCCLLEPFAVTLGTNASFKESVDLVCMPGRVTQAPPGRYPSQGWALSAGRAIGR